MNKPEKQEHLSSLTTGSPLDQARKKVLSFLETHPISPDQQKILLEALHSFDAFRSLGDSSQQISGLVEKMQNIALQKQLQILFRGFFTKH